MKRKTISIIGAGVTAAGLTFGAIAIANADQQATGSVAAADDGTTTDDSQGPVRSEETPLAGTDAERATAAALEAVPEDPSRPGEEFEASPSPSGGFAGQWVPESEGRWTIRPRDPSLAALAGTGAALETVRNDREVRDAEADRPLLEALARETGGKVVGPEDAAALVRSLPNRSVRIENPVRDPVRSSPAALILVLALLCAEWVLRRARRLA